MGCQQEAGLAGTITGKSCHHIGTTGKDFTETNLGTQIGEEFLKIGSERRLTRLRHAWIPLGIDTGDADQLPEQRDWGDLLHQALLVA
jgi:hypothetical protein